MSYHKYERIAPLYDVLDKAYEVSWKRGLRAAVFRDTGGMILDAGAGTGCNIPFYPENATVIGIDNSPRMLTRAVKRAVREGIEAEFLEMDLTRTSFPDDHFDAIAVTFVSTARIEPCEGSSSARPVSGFSSAPTGCCMNEFAAMMK